MRKKVQIVSDIYEKHHGNDSLFYPKYVQLVQRPMVNVLRRAITSSYYDSSKKTQYLPICNVFVL